MPSQPYVSDTLLPNRIFSDQLRKDLREDIQQEFEKLSSRLVDEIQILLNQNAVSPAMIKLDMQKVDSPLQHHKQTSADSLGGHMQGIMPEIHNGSGTSSMQVDVDMHHLHASKSLRHFIDEDASKHEQSLHNWLHHLTIKMRNQSKKLKEDPGTNSVGLTYFVHSWYFTMVSMSVILANAVWMGYDSDQALRKLNDPEHAETDWSSTVSLTFSIFYAVEVVLKVIALRKYFIFGVDWKWNILELCLVLLSIPEYLQAVGKFNILRLIRLIKLTRVLRLMRLIRFITSLREILLSFVDTIGCLFWSFVSVVLVMYMSSIFFMQAIGLLYEQGDAPPDEILEDFKSTASTMLTLFSVVSGGQDWYYFAQAFKPHSWIGVLSRYTFVLYIYFMMFGFVSVIIAVFCTKVNEAKYNDEDLMVAKEEVKYMSIIQKVIDVFHGMDLNVDERITRKHFTEYVKSSKSLALRGMPGFHGLQFFSLDKLWHILTLSSDTDDGTVDFAGFVLAILRLSGEVNSTELVLLSGDLERLDRRLERDITALEKGLKQLVKIEDALNAHSLPLRL